MTDEEKIEILLDTLCDIREKLDEAISQIDGSLEEVEDGINKNT